MVSVKTESQSESCRSSSCSPSRSSSPNRILSCCVSPSRQRIQPGNSGSSRSRVPSGSSIVKIGFPTSQTSALSLTKNHHDAQENCPGNRIRNALTLRADNTCQVVPFTSYIEKVTILIKSL